MKMQGYDEGFLRHKLKVLKFMYFSAAQQIFSTLFFRICYKISTVPKILIWIHPSIMVIFVPNQRVKNVYRLQNCWTILDSCQKYSECFIFYLGKIRFNGGKNRRASSDLDESRHLRRPVTCMPMVLKWDAMSFMLLGPLNSISLSNTPKKYYTP